DRYITADAHQYLPTRANRIELAILQAKTSSGHQETVIEKLHFHLPTLLDMGRDEEDLASHTNAKLLDRTRRLLRIQEELASFFPSGLHQGDLRQQGRRDPSSACQVQG
ncbi:hypothetical protein ACWCQZ_43750, partial [Streptomyces sp. NPDC002285]